MTSEKYDAIESLIGKDAKYRGDLVFDKGVRIDGTLEGTVRGNGMLVVGDSAEIDAEIHVGALIVLGGTLRGKVVATESIELLNAAQVHADLHTPDLYIQKGVVFVGATTMDATRSHDIASEPDPDADPDADVDTAPGA